MLIRRTVSGVRVWTPAKVNLFLEVLARRADGYHELATLMTAVSLYDTLRIHGGIDGSDAASLRSSLSLRPDPRI